MNTRLYVGNLSPELTKDDLNKCFSQIGRVVEVAILRDSDTGKSRGFGFVEMSSASKAAEALSTLNGTQLDGRIIKVEEAKPRTERRLRYPTTW